MMKEYIVTCKTKEDLQSLYDDMETPGGSLYIPDREVELKHRRPISRNTHYMLTDEEAEQIKQDPRVLDVELTPEERGAKVKALYTLGGDITEEEQQRELNNDPSYTLTSNRWSKTTNNNDTFRNWGMLRCVNEATFPNYGSDGSPNVSTTTVLFTSTGRNVDVVIVDGCIDPVHPEFAVNEDGTGGSRVNQFNWFSLNPEVTGGPATTYSYAINGDYTPGGDTESDNNHGCHVAGTACGNRRGWGRGTNIFNINPYGSAPSNVLSSQLIDYIRVWHSTKDINPETGKRNPTITNHSYGIFYDIEISAIEYVNYRGVQYNSPTAQQCTDFGLVNNGATVLDIPYLSSAMQTDIEDAILDGILFVGAAGNSNFKIDIAGGIDYDNTVKEFGFNPEYYHRGTSPTAFDNVINVGAIDATVAEQKASFSNCGPGISVYAPGVNIISSVHSGGVSDSRNSAYRVIKYNGTSMASPQVCGVVACLAEHWPRLTQFELVKYFNPQQNGENVWGQTHLATVGDVENTGADTLNYSVGNSGNSDYTFSGAATGNDVSITTTIGNILDFNVNAPGHPFWIKTSATTGVNDAVEVGVTNNGDDTGNVIWDTKDATPGTYYYICQYHPSMVGTITLTTNTSTTNTQGSTNRYLKSPKIRKVPNPAGTTYVGAASTSQQTWPRLDNKFRPVLNYSYYGPSVSTGDIDIDIHPPRLVYPRHPIWNRKLT